MYIQLYKLHKKFDIIKEVENIEENIQSLNMKLYQMIKIKKFYTLDSWRKQYIFFYGSGLHKHLKKFLYICVIFNNKFLKTGLYFIYCLHIDEI